MKRFFLATSALVVLAMGSANAADLRRPAYQPAPPPPMYSWTGLYWGVNVGYSWGREKDDLTVAAFGAAAILSDHQKVDGVIGGFQSGYNYQFGQWVFGLETDIQASGQKGSTSYCLFANCGVNVFTEHKLPWFGTARSRLGVLVAPTVLLYGTAGAAYGQVKSDLIATAGGATVATLSTKDTRAGWTAGAGIEGVIGGGWTAKLEYLYIDLGKETTTATLGNFAAATLDRRFTDNIVRVGFNYRWGGGGGAPY
jgi:outer membrane immunogenic protein